jgi:hypothetical protein
VIISHRGDPRIRSGAGSENERILSCLYFSEGRRRLEVRDGEAMLSRSGALLANVHVCSPFLHSAFSAVNPVWHRLAYMNWT